jgi:hypothetical protein
MNIEEEPKKNKEKGRKYQKKNLKNVLKNLGKHLIFLRELPCILQLF